MPNPPIVDQDDEQLKLEMRAMAELLLDIYEYRLQTETPRDDGGGAGILDDNKADRMMKERPTVKSNNNIK